MIKITATKKITSFLFAIAALFFFSCSSGNSARVAAKKKETSAPAYDRSFVTGKVTDSIRCKNLSGQNFALYLPSGYTPDKPFPVIYMFDAHGHGALPLASYKDIAEKYGFVLIGSNASRNGIPWDTNNENIKELIEDTHARINMDPKRIYTSGFSGGSRVAIGIAVNDGGIAGVIGCAAGFPSAGNTTNRKFDYLGMVGDHDFNFTEMHELDETMEHNGFAHQLLTLNGKHAWPPAADFETALLWMQVNAIKENLQPENASLITALKTDYDNRIAAATSAHDLLRQQELLAGMVRLLDGLADVSLYKKQLAGLEAGADYKNAVALQAQLEEKELNGQHELATEFTQHDEKWWAKKIAELNHNAHTAKTKQESLMYMRLVNYLGLAAYMNTGHALKANDLEHAAACVHIFKMADPENPDCSYLSALCFIKSGDTKQAISALNEAAAHGFDDVALLIGDPAFSSLRNDDEFKKVVARVRGNK